MYVNFRYNHEKNAELLKTRGISFEEIIQAITDGNLIAIKKHHNIEKYPEQKILYVRILTEVYSVPFIEENNNNIFLKTLFPNRKARKKLLR